MSHQDWQAVGQVNRVVQMYLARQVRLDLLHRHHIEVVIGTLTNGATAAAEVTVPAGCDFLWLGNLITPHPDQSNDSTGPAGFATLMRIELSAHSRQLGRHRDTAADAPAGWIPLMNVCGRGRMPFLWPWPILLAEHNQVRFDFLHRGSVDLEAARLSLLGVKIVKELAA